VRTSAEALQRSKSGEELDRKIDQIAEKLGLSPAELRRQVHGWAKPIGAHLPAVKELRDWIRGKVASDPDLSGIKSQGRINGIRRRAIDPMSNGLERDIRDALTSACDVAADADLTKIGSPANFDRPPGRPVGSRGSRRRAALHQKMSQTLERMLQSLSGLIVRILGRPVAVGQPRGIVDLPGP
jgi:hypothetical protein